jgi:hypothetical protein
MECSYNCFTFTKSRNLTIQLGSEGICTMVDGAWIELFLAVCCDGFTTPVRFGNDNNIVHGHDLSVVCTTSDCHPIRSGWCGRMDIIRSAAREGTGLCSMGSQSHDLHQRHIASVSIPILCIVSFSKLSPKHSHSRTGIWVHILLPWDEVPMWVDYGFEKTGAVKVEEKKSSTGCWVM